jgi:hypothetical protein
MIKINAKSKKQKSKDWELSMESEEGKCVG